MKTIKIGDVVHIYKSHTDTRAWGLCYENHTWPKRIPLIDGHKQLPTCPDCLNTLLKEVVGLRATNEKLEKEHETGTLDFERMVTLFDNLIHGQKWVNECLGNPDGNHYNSDKAEHKEGSYPFIPIGTRRTYRDFARLKEYLPTDKRWSGHKARGREVSFLDAGCGVGNVIALAMATRLVSSYHGLEFFDHTFKQAQTFLGITHRGSRCGAYLHQEDILTYNHYNRYDIVYFYCPFSNEDLQAKFEERLEDKMRIGAVLVPRLKKSRAINKDPRFARLDGLDNMWMKVKGGPRTVGRAASAKVQAYDPDKQQRIYEKYNFTD